MCLDPDDGSNEIYDPYHSDEEPIVFNDEEPIVFNDENFNNEFEDFRNQNCYDEFEDFDDENYDDEACGNISVTPIFEDCPSSKMGTHF